MTNYSLIRFLLVSVIIIGGSTLKVVTAKTGVLNTTQFLYNALAGNNSSTLPSEKVFAIAYKGHQALKEVSESLQKDILTVIDFSLSSNKKRLWIIDLENNQVLFNDYVAHGRNSGN